MKKNSFFYTNEEIKRMKELIRTGEPIFQISLREYENFGTTPGALRTKMYKLAKKTRRVYKQSSKDVITSVTLVDKTIISKSIAIPSGTVFEGECKRVTLHSDHFRIYF